MLNTSRKRLFEPTTCFSYDPLSSFAFMVDPSQSLDSGCIRQPPQEVGSRDECEGHPSKSALNSHSLSADWWLGGRSWHCYLEESISAWDQSLRVQQKDAMRMTCAYRAECHRAPKAIGIVCAIDAYTVCAGLAYSSSLPYSLMAGSVHIRALPVDQQTSEWALVSRTVDYSRCAS